MHIIKKGGESHKGVNPGKTDPIFKKKGGLKGKELRSKKGVRPTITVGAFDPERLSRGWKREKKRR